jgi:hypothetical protein
MIEEIVKQIKKINKGNIPTMLVFLSLIFVFFYRFLIGLGAMESIKYLLDAITITLTFISLRKKQFSNLFKLTILIYGLIIVVGTIARLFYISTWPSNVANYLMDIRMLTRYPLYAFVCTSVLNDDDKKHIKELVYSFNIFNSIYIVYQYFTVKVADYWMRGDYLNGFFGAYRGGNLYENVLLVIVTIIVFDDYLKNKIKAHTMIINIIINLFVATIIELKFFYVEAVIIFLIYFVSSFKELTRKKVNRSIIIFAVITVIGICFVNILYKLYPWMQGTLTSWERISDYLLNSHGDSQEMINRTTFLSDVSNMIFHGSVIHQVFGIGLGSANTGMIGGVLPEFTQKYSTTAYSWYSSSYMLVETGIIGFTLYLMTFLLPVSIKNVRHSSNSKMILCICIMSILMVFYNETFRTEAGLMMCLLFAVANKSDSDIRTD